LLVPLDNKIIDLHDIPYTLSYVIRKRMQIDGLNELPKGKRPSEKMIWDGDADEMERWIEEVVSGKHKPNIDLIINEGDIE
jgi:hypothetical protein